MNLQKSVFMYMCIHNIIPDKLYMYKTLNVGLKKM